jgi:tetratricopeptide (TPR) repeat protein
MRTRDLALAINLFVCCVCAGQSPANPGGMGPLEEGRLAYKKSQYGRAVELLHSAMEQEPRNGEIYLLLTKSFIELGQFDAAIQSAERAVAISPKDSIFHEWLGRAFGEKAARTSPSSAFSLARKTLREFETAVQLEERNFSAQQALIEFYCRAPAIFGGGKEKAAPRIARLEALDASEFHFAKGNCRRQKKEFAAVDAEFTLALESGARSAELIYDIGDYALKQSQPERLLAVAEAGQRVAPADPRADFYRGAAYILKGEKLDEAQRLMRAYLSRAPVRTGYPRPTIVHEWLGRALEQQGERDSAKREYQAALQADPKNKGAHEALKRLEKK